MSLYLFSFYIFPSKSYNCNTVRACSQLRALQPFRRNPHRLIRAEQATSRQSVNCRRRLRPATAQRTPSNDDEKSSKTTVEEGYPGKSRIYIEADRQPVEKDALSLSLLPSFALLLPRSLSLAVSLLIHRTPYSLIHHLLLPPPL